MLGRCHLKAWDRHRLLGAGRTLLLGRLLQMRLHLWTGGLWLVEDRWSVLEVSVARTTLALRLLGHTPVVRPTTPSLGGGLAALLARAGRVALLGLAGHLSGSSVRRNRVISASVRRHGPTRPPSTICGTMCCLGCCGIPGCAPIQYGMLYMPWPDFYTNGLERPRLSWSPLQRPLSSSVAPASLMAHTL